MKKQAHNSNPSAIREAPTGIAKTITNGMWVRKIIDKTRMPAISAQIAKRIRASLVMESNFDTMVFLLFIFFLVVKIVTHIMAIRYAGLLAGSNRFQSPFRKPMFLMVLIVLATVMTPEAIAVVIGRVELDFLGYRFAIIGIHVPKAPQLGSNASKGNIIRMALIACLFA
jgi:hypothetical protein